MIDVEWRCTVRSMCIFHIWGRQLKIHTERSWCVVACWRSCFGFVNGLITEFDFWIVWNTQYLWIEIALLKKSERESNLFCCFFNKNFHNNNMKYEKKILAGRKRSLHWFRFCLNYKVFSSQLSRINFVQQIVFLKETRRKRRFNNLLYAISCLLDYATKA